MTFLEHSSCCSIGQQVMLCPRNATQRKTLRQSYSIGQMSSDATQIYLKHYSKLPNREHRPGGVVVVWSLVSSCHCQRCHQEVEAARHVLSRAAAVHIPHLLHAHSMTTVEWTCGQLASVLTVITSECETKGDKPVGFYGPIVPPVPNAPSSECPQASIAACCRATGSITICELSQ